jgi:hypothetical protein
MADKFTPQQRSAFEISNLLHLTANAIKERNDAAYAAGKLTLDEYIANIGRETELRARSTLIVARDVSDVLRQVDEAGDNIQEAIDEAKSRIEQVQALKKGIEIFAAVLALAIAISEGNVPGTVAAVKAVRSATKARKPK